MVLTRSALPCLPATRLLPATLLLAACLLLAPAARADTLELTDGRIVEGMVIPDTHPTLGKGVYVVSRFGPTFIKQADIKQHRESKPIDLQIRDWVAQLEPRDVANRIRLAGWMRGLGRAEEAHELALQVLEWEPENADAHGLLGHVRHRGAWVTPEAAKRAEGYELHGGVWYTPEEWKNVAEAGKRAAEEAEKAAAQKALRDEVNRAVRLALSPDPAVRARGKARLEALAEEFDSERIRNLLRGIDEYIQNLDELRRQAAAAMGDIGAADGMVMGEIRATLSKLKRPIPVFQTNLAAGPVGANAPVSIQLPELEVIRVMTTMKMPAMVK